MTSAVFAFTHRFLKKQPVESPPAGHYTEYGFQALFRWLHFLEQVSAAMLIYSLWLCPLKWPWSLITPLEVGLLPQTLWVQLLQAFLINWQCSVSMYRGFRRIKGTESCWDYTPAPLLFLFFLLLRSHTNTHSLHDSDEGSVQCVCVCVCVCVSVM